MALGPTYGGMWLTDQSGRACLDMKRVRGVRLAHADFSDRVPTGLSVTEIVACYSSKDETILATYRDASLADAAFRSLTTGIITGDLSGFTWLPDEDPNGRDIATADLGDPFA